MIDKGFLKTLEDFWENKQIFRKKPYNFYRHCNSEEKELHKLYIHYKTFKWTKHLVFGTWILAGATIILAIATIVLACKTG